MDIGKHINSKHDILLKINKVQLELSEKEFNKSVQIGIFFFTTCVMLFFLTFFIMDFVNVLKIYFNKKRNVEGTTKYKVDDDNEYNKTGIEYENELDQIEEQIFKRNINLENRLKEMVEWKRSENIPNVNIENKIDMTVLEDKFDNYEYNDKKDGVSFWKMMLMPPKYYKLVNNKAKPFYRLNTE